MNIGEGGGGGIRASWRRYYSFSLLTALILIGVNEVIFMPSILCCLARGQ